MFREPEGEPFTDRHTFEECGPNGMWEISVIIFGHHVPATGRGPEHDAGGSVVRKVVVDKVDCAGDCPSDDELQTLADELVDEYINENDDDVRRRLGFS